MQSHSYNPVSYLTNLIGNRTSLDSTVAFFTNPTPMLRHIRTRLEVFHQSRIANHQGECSLEEGDAFVLDLLQPVSSMRADGQNIWVASLIEETNVKQLEFWINFLGDFPKYLSVFNKYGKNMFYQHIFKKLQGQLNTWVTNSEDNIEILLGRMSANLLPTTLPYIVTIYFNALQAIIPLPLDNRLEILQEKMESGLQLLQALVYMQDSLSADDKRIKFYS